MHCSRFLWEDKYRVLSTGRHSALARSTALRLEMTFVSLGVGWVSEQATTTATATATAKAEYRDLSTAAAKYAAFGRDDVRFKG